QAHSLFAGLPIIFEPNQGQANLDPADGRAKFVARGAGYSLFLGTQGATLSMVRRPSRVGNSGHYQGSAAQINAIEMKLAGANANAAVDGIEPLPGKSNYLIGNDRSKWRTGVPQ